MPFDASDNTLVCELRVTTGLALAWTAGGVVSLGMAFLLPLPGWVRASIAAMAAVYAAAGAWFWLRRMPARIVVTGDGRCRGVSRDGVNRQFGRVKGAVIRRRFVSVRTEARHLLITRGMVGGRQFRRLRARLRTAVVP